MTKKTKLSHLTDEEKRKRQRDLISQWKLKNPEKVKGYYLLSKKDKLLKQKQRRKENLPLFMWRNAKARAKRKSLEFDITFEDISIPETCPILGIPLIAAEGTQTDNSPSLDRIIPELGYVKGNIRVISNLANTMKNSASVEHLIKFAKWITDNLGKSD